MTLARDDRTIVELLRSGEPDAVAALINTYAADVKAVAFSICRNEQAAEDVTAQTLVIAWRQIASLRDADRLRPWLLRIASREALQLVRRMPKAQVMTDNAPGYVNSSTGGFESQSDMRLDLAKAMLQLPPRTRAVIALRYVTDLSVEEIGRVLGRSKNTVKTELRLGLRRLRELLPDL